MAGRGPCKVKTDVNAEAIQSIEYLDRARGIGRVSLRVSGGVEVDAKQRTRAVNSTQQTGSRDASRKMIDGGWILKPTASL